MTNIPNAHVQAARDLLRLMPEVRVRLTEMAERAAPQIVGEQSLDRVREILGAEIQRTRAEFEADLPAMLRATEAERQQKRGSAIVEVGD